MLPLYYYNKVEIASVFHIHVCRMWKTHRSLHHHPRRGRACPARALSHNHPLTFHIVGRGLDPSAGRRGRRPLQRWPEIVPTPAHARGGLRAGRPTIFSSPPVGAGHARPATSPPPAVNLPPLTHSPKTPNPQPACHPPPHNLYPPTAVTPIYTLPKLCPQTLSKKSKKLAKTC